MAILGRRSVMAGAAAGALARPALAAGPTKITFLTSWFAEAEHGGFYQAKATGLYEKAGLDVEIKMGGPQINGMQLLTAGAADIMIGYDIQVLKSLENNVPMTTIGACFQFDLTGLMTHEDVKSLAAVKGHKTLISVRRLHHVLALAEAEIRLHRRHGRRRHLQPAALPGRQDRRDAGLPDLRAVRGAESRRQGQFPHARRRGLSRPTAPPWSARTPSSPRTRTPWRPS